MKKFLKYFLLFIIITIVIFGIMLIQNGPDYVIEALDSWLGWLLRPVLIFFVFIMACIKFPQKMAPFIWFHVISFVLVIAPIVYVLIYAFLHRDEILAQQERQAQMRNSDKKFLTGDVHLTYSKDFHTKTGEDNGQNQEERKLDL